jgi:hypothetical protein
MARLENAILGNFRIIHSSNFVEACAAPPLKANHKAPPDQNPFHGQLDSIEVREIQLRIGNGGKPFPVQFYSIKPAKAMCVSISSNRRVTFL